MARTITTFRRWQTLRDLGIRRQACPEEFGLLSTETPRKNYIWPIPSDNRVIIRICEFRLGDNERLLLWLKWLFLAAELNRGLKSHNPLEPQVTHSSVKMSNAYQKQKLSGVKVFTANYGQSHGFNGAFQFLTLPPETVHLKGLRSSSDLGYEEVLDLVPAFTKQSTPEVSNSAFHLLSKSQIYHNRSVSKL